MILALFLLAADPTGAKMVPHARELLGTPYDFGGRLGARGLGEGIDCQGVLFYAVERAFPRCGWRSYDVMPTRAIPRGELGKLVLGPLKSEQLKLDQLLAGDVLWLVGHAENPAEPAIDKLEGTPVWVWHTGLYAGEGKFIVGDHYAGETVEIPLLPYLKEHADTYAGLMVTRISKTPKPARCRTDKMPAASPPTSTHPTAPKGR